MGIVHILLVMVLSVTMVAGAVGAFNGAKAFEENKIERIEKMTGVSLSY